MKLKRFFSFLLFAAVITAFTACDEDEDTSVPKFRHHTFFGTL